MLLLFSLLFPSLSLASFVLTSRTNLSASNCTDPKSCNEWPASSDGQVVLFELMENFQGKLQRRAFRAYLPARVTSSSVSVPLLLSLHGGYGSGENLLLEQPFAKLADGRQVGWRPNTADCKYQYPKGYRNAQDQVCLPPQELVTSEPFVAVFPDGLPDDGKPNSNASQSIGHWEDGRTPSPGWSKSGPADAQHRDDVGFVDIIVKLLLAEQLPNGGALVDPKRVYMVGTSNGGMMTHRVACHVGDAKYPNLVHVAAVAINIASMPFNLFSGSSGRAQCNPRLSLSVQYIVGKGISTPNCTSYPCDSPVVDGDAHMPFLAAGERANGNSPELGSVVSHLDAKSLFVRANEDLLGVKALENVTSVGFFCVHTKASFPGSEHVVEAFVTDGGHHYIGGTLGDIPPFSKVPAFLFQFQRSGQEIGTTSPTSAPTTPAKPTAAASPTVAVDTSGSPLPFEKGCWMFSLFLCVNLYLN